MDRKEEERLLSMYEPGVRPIPLFWRKGMIKWFTGDIVALINQRKGLIKPSDVDDFCLPGYMNYEP